MKLHIVIGRNGRLEETLVYLDDATRIWCTKKAKLKLVDFLKSRDLLCHLCGIAARSDELVDGVCKTGVGCTADVDGASFKGRELNFTDETAVHSVFSKVWNTFLSTLPRDVGRDEPDLLTPDADDTNDGRPIW